MLIARRCRFFCCSCRLLPQWVAAGDCPESAGALVQQMPPANANTLRLLVQTCSYMNEQAALNEMDSQALAEVGALAFYNVVCSI
jgi:hypothetical protein